MNIYVSDKVEIQSLEAHEEEIRKPLEEEIERLKNRIEILYNAQTITTKNYEEQIPVFEQQSRQKVIAELEEWMDGYDWWMQDGVIYIVRKDLRQKLKEMKEV